MAVLVTGASGFIGSHVVLELSRRGYSVRAGMRDLGYSSIFAGFENIECVKMDLFDVESLREAVRGCEDIIHCAAALYVGAKDVKSEVVDPSVIGVENLCSVMDDVKRIIHTSSVAAIRSTKYENGQIFTNQDWCDDATITSNPYGLAKAEGERLMRSWAENRPIRLVTIHPSVVFGPILHTRHLEGSMSYLKHFATGPPFVLDIHVNFVDVRDVACAHVNALEQGDDRSRHIIHKEGMWMKEVGGALTSLTGRKYATKRLPRYLAYLLAVFHPKLSIKRLRGTLGTHVKYDVGDSFSILSLPNYETAKTLTDSISSLLAQD
ncbi:MAG: NAD-dependent epimerase/dehydratase family protein [Euryarchaeota archaeon]|jgi:dihydroflavonol-4-reductase|nr:NAD-dependent epimerase/dehydratase family protein [Euryarchaeota archaeon]MBT4982662.1 NAD-dependent epimerase/dehydratase family protein [Euryarchaeota archaeon]